MSTEFTVPADRGVRISAVRWDPTSEAVGVVVLVHGMGEHIGRYEETAQALIDDGYVVFGYDHRGHGRSRLSGRELGDLGPGGWAGLVSDIGRVVDTARGEFPDLPLILLAHSMGSFATQQFLLDGGSAKVDAVVLSGTAALDGLEPALDLDAELDLSMFNAPFAPARTDFDWLSRDENIVDAYVADPLCGFGIDQESGRDMFVAARRIAETAAVATIRADLPILIAVGDRDPVNGGGGLVDLLAAHFRAGGLDDVTVRVFKDARHEILNETNRGEVRDDLLDWMATAVDKGADE
ncbi:alpha/beta hydrolase [Williamsia sp. 1138]|uniref:alpha/beta fold hydrolase n=1 Tax=Williamsia sp. 1138 TaxID=1903117 RepID=UPI000A0F7EDF|nr:alpha/beta hydrolase [Williamsia sp. 1138]OZG26668.1 alpha/beta hydrolase [Williamsia sp. 1138]